MQVKDKSTVKNAVCETLFLRFLEHLKTGTLGCYAAHDTGDTDNTDNTRTTQATCTARTPQGARTWQGGTPGRCETREPR